MFENLAAVEGGNGNVVAIEAGQIRGPGDVDQVDLEVEFLLELSENFQRVLTKMTSFSRVEIDSRETHGSFNFLPVSYHCL